MTMDEFNAPLIAAVSERQGQPREATGPNDATWAYDDCRRRLIRQTNVVWMEGAIAELDLIWADRNAAWNRVRELTAELCDLRKGIKEGTTE